MRTEKTILISDKDGILFEGTYKEIYISNSKEICRDVEFIKSKLKEGKGKRKALLEFFKKCGIK